MDWEDDSNFEDDVEIIDDNKDIFNVDTFTKLMKVVQDFSNFENYKILFLCSLQFFL